MSTQLLDQMSVLLI